MSFINKLDYKLLATDLNTLSEQQLTPKFFEIIKKLLTLDIANLFRLADSGGDVEEAIINDLYIDVLKEAVDDDYSHYTDVKWDDDEVIDLSPVLREPKLSVKSIFNTNYHKLLELKVKTPDISFRGYVIDKLSRSDAIIAKELRSRVKEMSPGDPPPFRWYRTTDDALRQIEVLERNISNDQLKKPSLKPQVDKSVVHDNPISIEDLIPTVAKHYDKKAAEIISTLNRQQLAKVVSAGKEATKQMSMWTVAKTIFLGYLSLAALVKGSAGLAALVIGFLAVQGIDYLRKNKPEPQKPQAPKEPLRIRQKPSSLGKLYK